MVLESAQSKLTELEGILKEFEVWRIRCSDMNEMGEHSSEEGSMDLKKLEKEMEEAKQREEKALLCVQTYTREEMNERRELQIKQDELARAVKTSEERVKEYQQALETREG